jgi:predicted ATPase
MGKTMLKRRLALPFLLLLATASFVLYFPQKAPAPILKYLKAAAPKKSHRVIVTGGPGVGKTSIIRHLQTLGHVVVEEAATDVIRKALACGIEKPWDRHHKADFNDEILDLQYERNQALPTNELVFFDRSMIDTLTYALIPRSGTASLANMVRKLQGVLDDHFYHHTVFFIDNLKTICNDEIRHENLEELHLIEKHLEQNYQALGYKVIHIPPDSIENRTKKILSLLQ